MRTYDIEFQLDDGSSYGFMLAKSDGKKAWAVNRIFRPPPSMIKQQIDIVITAQEDEISASAIRQLKRMKDILADLEKIMISSKYTRAHCNVSPANTKSIKRWNEDGALHNPKGNTL